MYFFAGSYSEKGSPAPVPIGTGIICCSFDPQNGTIRIIGSQLQRNASYPVTSVDGEILYAAEEMFASENPQLLSYNILEKGSLQQLNAVPLAGDFACHLLIANNTIMAANYVSGDMMVYSLEDDGRIGAMMQLIKHEGSGINKERQEAPHPHMLYAIDNELVYCVDLGIDQLKAYRFDAGSKEWIPATGFDIAVRPGAGARHIDVDSTGEWLTLIGELTAELFLFRKIDDRFQLVDSSCLEEKEMSAAAVRIHANGRFVYFSERKTNSIYSFLITDGKLRPLEKSSCAGKTPRDIAIDPTGEWLLAANQDSNTIAVFKIDVLTGKLRFVHDCYVPTPTSICWQHQDTSRIIK